MGSTDRINSYLETAAGVAYASGDRPIHYIYVYGPEPQTVSQLSASVGLKLNLVRDGFTAGIMADAGPWVQTSSSSRQTTASLRGGLFIEGENRLLAVRGGPLLTRSGPVGLSGQLQIGSKIGEHLLLMGGLSYTSSTLFFPVEPYDVPPDADPEVRRDSQTKELTMTWNSLGAVVSLALVF